MPYTQGGDEIADACTLSPCCAHCVVAASTTSGASASIWHLSLALAQSSRHSPNLSLAMPFPIAVHLGVVARLTIDPTMP
jgi:hypothetical protein